METVAGIFASRSAAEDAIREINGLGIPNDRIALLTPGMSDKAVERAVPTDDTEQPGMGAAMGGTVGGAIGVAGGATLGTAAASLLVPGVGPVIAGGILGAALLGAGGTVTGIAAGQALEKELESGLPHDEIYLYEDALRQGRSVIVVFVENEGAIYSVRAALAGAGAEGIDEARENWWIGVRDAEEAAYEASGRTFQTDEASYRRGFEDACKRRGKESEASGEFIASPVGADNEAFRCGYERGLNYQKNLREKYNG
jgi:hypothetical protein